MAVTGMTPELLERMAREVVKHHVLCGDLYTNVYRHRLWKERGAAWRAVYAALRLGGSVLRCIWMFSSAYNNMLRRAAMKAMQACGGRVPSVSELVSHAPRWVRDVEPRLRRAQRVIDRLAQHQTIGKINLVRTLLAEVYRSRGPSTEWDAARHQLWGCVRLVAMEKVRLLQSCGDLVAAAGTGLRAADWLAIDLALLYGDDALVTQESLREYSQLSTLTVLFSLVQQYELHAPTADDTRWRAALAAYAIKGRASSPVTLQRRWHELLQLARSMLQEYVRHRDKQHAPPPLVRQLAVRFPQLVTAPRQWRQLVAQGLIHVPPLNEYLAAMEEEDAAPAAAAAGTHCDHEDDDIMIVEKDVETIDLAGMESARDDDDALMTHELSDTDEPDMTSIETKVGQVYRNLEEQINSQSKELNQIQNAKDSIYVDDSSSESNVSEKKKNRNVKYYYIGADQIDISKIGNESVRNMIKDSIGAQSSRKESIEKENQHLTVEESSIPFTAMFGTNPILNCIRNIQPYVALPSMQIDSDSSSDVPPVTAMTGANSDTSNVDGGLPDGIALLESLDPATVQTMIVFSDEEHDMDDASQQNDETQPGPFWDYVVESDETQNVSIQNDKTQDDAILQNDICQINNIGSESENDSVPNVAVSIERETNKVATKSKARIVDDDENTNNSKRIKTIEEDSIASEKFSKDDTATATNIKVGPSTSHNITSRISFEGTDTSTADIAAGESLIFLSTRRRTIEQDTAGNKLNEVDTTVLTNIKIEEPRKSQSIKSRISFEETDASTPDINAVESSVERKAKGHVATKSKITSEGDENTHNSNRGKTIEEDTASLKLNEVDTTIATEIKVESNTSQSIKSRISFEETDATISNKDAAECSIESENNKIHVATKSKARIEEDENINYTKRRKTFEEDTAVNEVDTTDAINANVKEEPSASQSIKSSITFEETDEKSQLDTRIHDKPNTLKNEMTDVIDSKIVIDDINMSTVLQARQKDREKLLKKLQHYKEFKVSIATKPDELIKQNVVNTSADSEGMTGTASRLGGVGSDDVMSRDGSRGSSRERAASCDSSAHLLQLCRDARVQVMRLPRNVLEAFLHKPIGSRSVRRELTSCRDDTVTSESTPRVSSPEWVDAATDAPTHTANPPAEKEEVTLTVENLEEILDELKETQPEEQPSRAYCCAARRYLLQRAARERARARRGKRKPLAIPPHRHPRGAECTCCCRAALHAAPGPARLHAAARSLHTAIHTLLTQQSKSSAAPPVVVPEPTTDSAEEAKSRKKKRPRPPRRPAPAAPASPAGGDTAEDAAGAVEGPKASALKSDAERLADDYQEWLRARNEHYKYFRLPARCTHDKQAKTPSSATPAQPPTEPVGFQRTDGLQEARYITVPDLVPTKEFIKTLEQNISFPAPIVATEQAPATQNTPVTQNPPVTQTTYTVETNKATHTRAYVSPTCLLVELDEPARTDGVEALRLTVTVAQNQPTTDQQPTAKQPTINQQPTINPQPIINQPTIKQPTIDQQSTAKRLPIILKRTTNQQPTIKQQSIFNQQPNNNQQPTTNQQLTIKKQKSPPRYKPILPRPPPWCPVIESVHSLAQVSISDSPPKVTQPMETLTTHNTTLEQSSVPTSTLTEPLLATELPVVPPTPPQPATIVLQQPTMVLQPASELVQMPLVPHLPGSASYQTRLLEIPLSNLTTPKAGVSNSIPSKPPVAYLHTSWGSTVSKNKSIDEPRQEDSPQSMPLTAQIPLSSLESAQSQVISSQAQFLNQSHIIQPIGITTSCGDEAPVLLVTVSEAPPPPPPSPPPPPHSLLAYPRKLPQYISWETFLKVTRPPISTADFLKGWNRTTIELLRLPRGKPMILVPGNESGDGIGVLVAEPWLPCDNPTYWTTLGARLTDVDDSGDAGSSQETPHHSDPSRLKVESLAKVPGANNTVQGAGDTGGSTVAPYYKKLSNHPLVYAKVWTAVSDLGALHAVLAGGGGGGGAARAWWPRRRRVERPASAAAALLRSWVSEDPVISIDSDSE